MFTFVVHNYFNIELQKELFGKIMNLCLKSGIFYTEKMRNSIFSCFINNYNRCNIYIYIYIN